MTETKQDIQAQIDQLHDEWLLDRERYKVSLSKRLPTRSDVTFKWLYRVWAGVLLIWAGGMGIDFMEFDTSDSSASTWLSGHGQPMGLIALLLNGLACLIFFRREKKAKAYFLHLKSYESKRSELQAKLDALD